MSCPGPVRYVTGPNIPTFLQSVGQTAHGSSVAKKIEKMRLLTLPTKIRKVASSCAVHISGGNQRAFSSKSKKSAHSKVRFVWPRLGLCDH